MRSGARTTGGWWSIFGFAAAWVAVGSVLLLLGLADGSLTPQVVLGQFALLPPAASFSVAGLVVARRQPRNACGWLMLVIGAMWSLGVSPPTPDGAAITWATAWGWVPPFGLMATHLPLRLPDGASRRRGGAGSRGWRPWRSC